ncbi:Protein urg3 [Penicillium oxalicum]|uniref:Protein urg3 n=1 Tax=Penicillium oxalicum TaxID=69781 RepID=UPI0020B7B0B1|nr:Protein urg3 [Penicillium oxalicum]KAI2785916.1 Protein urg3 [Penicillium oxalicum]
MSDIEYLKGLDAVRERAHLVLGAAEKNQLLHFDYDASKMGDVADYVAGVISRDFGPDKYDQIPPHGRWQHFDVGGVSRVSSLIQRWESQGWDQLEVTRRLIDLFFVAVLLDAGAGDVWKFQEPGECGPGVRKVGGDVEVELVDGQALVALDVDTFKRHFQITEENPLVGAASRVELLQRVGSSLMKLPDYFGSQGRPGQLVDYLVRQAGPSKSLDFTMLWKILQETLLPAWPSNRTRIADIPIGDAWPLQVLSNLNGSKDTSTHNNQTHHIAPFHKLTQWLAYSLTVPFMRVLDMQWKNLEKGTGLPEYRNGGLFVDLGVLKLKPQALDTGLASSRGNLPSFEATSDVIVEWRAMTVALLDKLHELISARFADQGVTLSMPQMLEAGSWKSGRELAAQYRPESKSSPILIDGDGTLF